MTESSRSIDRTRGVRCIAWGSMSQSSTKLNFRDSGITCMANSVVASAFFTYRDAPLTSPGNIDSVLFSGVQYYQKCNYKDSNGRAQMLAVEDLFNTIILPENVSIKIQELTQVGNDEMLYTCIGSPEMNTNIWLNNLRKRIECGLVQAERYPNAGFLYVSNNKAISYWKKNNKFLVFDPHSVDDCRKPNANGVARLFECANINALAKCLHNGERQSDYEIIMIEFVRNTILETSSPISVADQPPPPLPTKRRRSVSTESEKEERKKLARKKYAEKNPDKVKESRKKYIERNPEKVSKSRDIYLKKNLEKVKESRKIFGEKKADKIVEYRKNWEDLNVEKSKARHIKYNVTERSIASQPPQIRQRTLPFGDLSGNDLNQVKLHRLKSPGSLISPDTYRCPFCSAALFEEEKRSKMWCCGQGKLAFDKLPGLDGANFYLEKEFLNRARGYNSVFSFTTVGSNLGKGFIKASSTNTARGEFLTLHGRVYHRVLPLDDPSPKNMTRFYILDNEEEARSDVVAEMELDNTIALDISQYLHKVNPFIEKFKMVASEPADDAFMILKTSVSKDKGNHSEVVALINPTSHDSREVKVWKKGGGEGVQGSTFVKIYRDIYEPLHYPLIFPHGTPGWSLDLKDLTPEHKHVNQVKYYRMRLLSEERFVKLRRLTQEYVVDMYARVEEQRLDFLRTQQENYTRIASKKVLTTDFEFDETIEGGGGPQKGRIYLPSSFTQSERYYKVNYLDGLSIIQRKGKPSYFVTFTCNPKWREISDSLYPGQYGFDRPDLVVRVFKQKYEELVRLIKTGRIFGSVEWIIHVVEFQKRGLPHAHIVFRVEGGGPKSSDELDNTIRANIPSQKEDGDGRLRKAVLNHQIHNCEDYACTDNKEKSCSKGYPKEPCDVTHADGHGSYVYRRPCVEKLTEEESIKYGDSVDDTKVVPYNPFLLLHFDCHVNVELATTEGVIAYLMKYMYKGPEATKVNVVQGGCPDEIDNYIKMRHICASEAYWRIFEYRIIHRSPTVETLPVHLPDCEPVIYRQGNEEKALEKNISKLVLYLSRPKIDKLDNLTYQDYFERYFVKRKTVKDPKRIPKRVELIEYDNKTHVAYERQKGDCVCRLNWISQTLGEVFYLRMLLANFPADSFDALRTVRGKKYATYQEAALKRGLLTNKSEYSGAMNEAKNNHAATPQELVQLFFTVVLFGGPGKLLWVKFHDDFNSGDDELCLTQLSTMLRRHGKTLSQIGLKQVACSAKEADEEINHYDIEQLKEYTAFWECQFNEKQKIFYDIVLRSVEERSNKSRAFFLDGPAGTGKTVLLNAIASKLRSEKRIVLCTATTGIAALNYPNGTTAHSMFRYPFEIDMYSVSGVTFESERGELIRKSSLIIYDECSMVSTDILQVLNLLLQDMMINRTLFGGKTIIFAGDFRQIPPIVKDGETLESYLVSLKEAPFKSELIPYKLEKIMRSREDLEFSNFVLAIGENRIESSQLGDGIIPLYGINSVDTLEELIDFVFPLDKLSDPEVCHNKAVLSLTNESIDEINQIVLDSIEGEEVSLYSADELITDDGKHSLETELITTDALHSTNEPGIPGHILKLKVNSVCMIVRNLSFHHGLVNGTKVIIEAISETVLKARKAGTQETVYIPRVPFEIKTSSIQMVRIQFPVRLAYAMTVNKSQGKTLDTVGLDLRSDCFSHGQLYVAMGRVRLPEHIVVLVPQSRKINNVPHTKNYVYQPFIN